MPAERAAELIDGFEPESDLERVVVEQPALLEGLAWGKPRRGHPEGCVGHHVAELLKRINGVEPGRTACRSGSSRSYTTRSSTE